MNGRESGVEDYLGFLQSLHSLSGLIDDVLKGTATGGGNLGLETDKLGDGNSQARLTERLFLREIKLLKTILRTNPCRRAMERLEIDPDTLIPWSRMEASGLTTLSAFARTQRDPDHRGG